MLTIGLVLGGEFSRYCALDADGKVTEEGSALSTEAGFRQRFASIPPSIFAVAYNPEARDLYATLTGLGHTLFFSGAVSESVKEAIAPHVLQVAGRAPAFVISRHAMRDGDPTALRLALSAAESGEIIDAAYFIGPVGDETDFDVLPASPLADARDPAAVRNGDRRGAEPPMSEYDLARRLTQLVRSDESCLATVPVLVAA